MALTSEHVNFLVYRYLLEAAESSILSTGLPGSDVPVGTLVTILQKGFQYAELEANLTDDSRDLYGEFTPLSAETIMTQDVEELRQTVRAWHERREAAALGALAAGPLEIELPACVSLPCPDTSVSFCCWTPEEAPAELLAAASADGTLRLFRPVEPEADAPAHGPRPAPAAALVCEVRTVGECSALEWSPDGRVLASACLGGPIELWDAREGVSNATGPAALPRLALLEGHSMGIFALRWNRRGDLLLSGSVDCSAVVWDARSGSVRCRTSFHSAPVLDCDWRTNAMYATASADRSVAVFRVGDDRPVKVWRGHTQDVNSVRWDAGGKLLASGSDDGTVRVWSLTSERALHVVPGHAQEVNCVRWGPGDVLASAGADGLVQLFDAEAGEVVHRLRAHGANVPHLRWSPGGDYLASADEVGLVLVWDAQTGELARSIQCPAMINDLSWAPGGEALAVGLAEGEARLLVCPLVQRAAAGDPEPAAAEPTKAPSAMQT
ncbi:hypothetical protein QBZ16_000712 [Prototheca wickerhamii]|uniref:Uncharacterized protein n=1 Tax=Prototheca wickerhamii TaxID=3111 RepID=A0AAD9IM12_PROWI|nr:hypothetical protein QBZ16_000712 [Prototheca wickerhamii]